MKKELSITRKLKNADGKRLLEKTMLEYSREIIIELKDSPELLPQVLNELEISEDDFFEAICGEKKKNITFYDETLTLTKRKTKNSGSKNR